MVPFGIKLSLMIRIGTLLGEGKVKLAKKIRNYVSVVAVLLPCMNATICFILKN